MTSRAEQFYSSWHDLYDLMIDWPTRLRADIPALTGVLRDRDARRVLDVSCGSGRHALALAQAGYNMAGADLNADLLRHARRAAAKQPAENRPRFFKWDLARLAPQRLQAAAPFDIATCLGNSFPHLLTDADIDAALHSLRSLLTPNGALLLQFKNLERRRREKRTQLPLLRRQPPGGAAPVFFLRYYDFDTPAKGRADFHLAIDGPRTLHQKTTLRSWEPDELRQRAERAGFRNARFFEDLALQRPFHPDRAEDIVALFSL